LTQVTGGGTPLTGAPPTTPQAPGFVQLYDSVRPGLSAGAYQLTVSQSIGGVNTGTYLAPRSQAFTVSAPRFALDPGDIGELYPPADSNGVFSAALPSIVLNRRTLPWEQVPATGSTAPWMALLTLTAAEIVPDPATGLPLRTSTVADFLTPPLTAAAAAPSSHAGASTLGPPSSPPALGSRVAGPAIDPAGVPADVLASTMTSIVVPAGVLTGVAPTLAEAGLLAHVRQTDTASQAASDAAQDGWYSVVLGNRFPAAARAADGTAVRSIACLVSLEGLTAYLPGATTPPSGPYGFVRLVVLASWSFVSNPSAGEGFAQLMAGLLPTGDSGALLPRVPVPASAPASAAVNRLALGYVPVDYRLATGETTFGWYRGPLTPFPAPPLPAPADGSSHYATAAELTVYAQGQGVFDVSYAAAFEAGRLAALADRGFAVALVNARRAAFQTVAAAQTRLASPLAAAATPTAVATPSTALATASATGATAKAPAPAPVGRPSWQRFGALLRDGMGAELTEALASVPQPTTDTAAAAAQPTSAQPAAAVPIPPPATTTDPVAQMRAVLARADVSDLLAAQAFGGAMDPVTDWLARLALLHGVPFRHLVPDERMLPVESVRFFYLDPNWIAALIDGALSIGVEGSRDLELQQTVSAALVATVAAKVGSVRAAQRARPDLAVPTGGAAPTGGASTAIALASPAPAAAASPASASASAPSNAPTTSATTTAAVSATAVPQRAGVLLRSSAVAGWPGMVIQADGGTTSLLRLDRLSDSVLLAVFDAVPTSITLGEPWHGLRFGVPGSTLQLRNSNGASVGRTFPIGGGPSVLTMYTRAPASGTSGGQVLAVGPLSAALLVGLNQVMGQTLVMGSALFALQLVLAASQLTFQPSPPAAPLAAAATPPAPTSQPSSQPSAQPASVPPSSQNGM
jgi:hypothetical protein